MSLEILDCLTHLITCQLELKKLEKCYLNEDISLTIKSGRIEIKGILKMIDSKNPVIGIDEGHGGGTDIYRIDIFEQEIEIKRPKEGNPYLEVRM